MQYPLPESIGDPDLFVGREKEFADFDKWLRFIPKRLSKSRVILARRKSGKTAFVQRIFNRLWSENGKIIPFYFNVSERGIQLSDFAVEYYRTFASQYISFLERDMIPIRSPLTLEQIREYGRSRSVSPFVTDVGTIRTYKEEGSHDLVWQTAATAPHRFAGLYDCRILTIIDEFQNTGGYIYTDANHQFLEKTIPGTWHELSESKIAPMLVTGSYVGWLINIIDTYLEAGRLKRIIMNPYLTPEEGLEAVYTYSQFYEEPITNETAFQINQLCMADPFFISCVISSPYDEKDLTSAEGVVSTVSYEITDKLSEMSMTWGEYIELSLRRINDIHAKTILLHLTRYADRDWTPRELRETLNLDLSDREIHERLRVMVSADLIREGSSDIDYRGLTDGTLCIILRSRFEKEISTFEPDLKQEFREELERLRKERNRLQGMVNHLTGKFAEYQLATEFRSRKRFSLARYFSGVRDDTELNVTEVSMRVKFHRADGKEMEADVVAESDCGRIIFAEVKKTKEKIGIIAVTDFLEKAETYVALLPEKIIIPVFFSAGGFTGEAAVFCREHGIGTAEEILI